MKAAVVAGPGQPPRYQDFVDPPTDSNGHWILSVTAAALTPVAKVMASGGHYASGGTAAFVAGLDGVGTSPSGQRMYFARGQAPFGAFAERVLVERDNCIPIPDGVADVTAAAIANPGLSSVAALLSRAHFTRGETVLIHGATGAAGMLAVVLARRLGARRIIATGRNSDALQRLRELGADAVVELGEPDGGMAALTHEFATGGVDVILDYIYGTPSDVVIAAIAGAAKGVRPIRYCVIGGVGSADAKVSSNWLRSAPVTLMGSGMGSLLWSDFLAATKVVFDEAAATALDIPTTTVPLSEIGEIWDGPGTGNRIVFTP